MSSSPCRACRHEKRAELDALLVSGNTPVRTIADQFHISKSAIARHKPHIAKSLVKVEAVRREAEAQTVYSKVKRLEDDARRMQKRAEDEGDLRAALVAVDKLLAVVRFLNELKPERPDADTWRREMARLKDMTDEEIENELRARGCPEDALPARPAPVPDFVPEYLPPDLPAPTPVREAKPKWRMSIEI